MKPVFIVGGSITAFAYAGTIFAANHARHHPSFHEIQDSNTKRILSAIALFGGVVASIACILMTILDTDRFHSIHTTLLLLTFAGIAVSAILTVVVYFDQTFTESARYPALKN